MATFTIPFSSCSAAIIPFPTLYGAQILSLSATPLTNFSTVPTINPSSAPPFNGSAVCNITVTYTHPGENDTINVKAWLPFQNYNDRLQSIGGSGWTTGRGPVSYTFMEAAILEGYATSTTDAGFGMTYSLTGDPSSWALLSPGNVNIYALQDLASVSLNDQAIIAKDLARSFYGQAPRYAYWYGGSQGGRQGYMLAQRYPDAYHGILAALPAINWGQVLVSALWPALFMEWTGQFPHSCELDYITNSSVAACDGKDGVMDGISVNPDMCDFTPFDLVGKSFNCLQEGTMMKVSNAAASVANATFAGPRSTKGESLWYGPNFGTDLTGDTYGAGFGTAATTCSSNGTCVPVINNLYASWIPLFMERNPSFNQLNLTHEEYDYIFHAAVQQYDSIINTDDPGLSEFRDKGRKMLTYHGLIDGLIPTKGTQHYYDAVTALMPDVQDFYRYFEAPGLPHGFTGPGGTPATAFDALRSWVENGTVPETLPLTFPPAGSQGSGGPVSGGPGSGRFLCAYPKRSIYNATCRNSADSTCFFCA